MTILSNNEIELEIEAKKLILGAANQMIEGASYQLRLGNVYYDLSEGGKRFELTPGEKVLIKPGHRVVLITAEELLVPADILAKIVSKGALFSVGLSPVATYADPGFTGNLGIVTQNLSDKYIELPQGEPIAKVDFTRLSSPATKLYQGQHGFQAGIWPIKTHLQKEHHEIKDDIRVKSEKDEALALLPNATRVIIRSLETRLLWTMFALVVVVAINTAAILLVGSEFMNYVQAIVVNFVTTAIFGIGTLVVNLRKRTE